MKIISLKEEKWKIFLDLILLARYKLKFPSYACNNGRYILIFSSFKCSNTDPLRWNLCACLFKEKVYIDCAQLKSSLSVICLRKWFKWLFCAKSETGFEDMEFMLQHIRFCNPRVRRFSNMVALLSMLNSAGSISSAHADSGFTAQLLSSLSSNSRILQALSPPPSITLQCSCTCTPSEYKLHIFTTLPYYTCMPA